MKKSVSLTAMDSVIKDETGTEHLLSVLSEAEKKRFLRQMGNNLELEFMYQKRKHKTE